MYINELIGVVYCLEVLEIACFQIKIHKMYNLKTAIVFR